MFKNQFFAIALPFIAIALAFKGDSNKVSYNSSYKSWKSEKFKESNAEKKPWTKGKKLSKWKQRATTIANKSYKSNNYIKSKMSNIAIKIGNSVFWVH